MNARYSVVEVARILEEEATHLKGLAFASRQRANEAPKPDGHGDEEEGVCDACGQHVSADHLREQHAKLEAAAKAAAKEAKGREEAARIAMQVADGERLALIL